MLSTFIAFGQAPMMARLEPVPVPAGPRPTNFIEPYDQRIYDYLVERVGYAIKSWTLLNAITAAEKPRSEAERRRIMRKLLERHKLLLHEGAIRRSGRFHVYLPVAGQPAPLNPFMRNIPRRRRRIRRKQVFAKRPVSVATAHISTSASAPSSLPSQLNHTAAVVSVTASSTAISAKCEPWKTKSAPAPALVHPDTAREPQVPAPGLAQRIMLRIALLQCGAQLARWRWLPPKKWTGYLHGERCWVGQRVLMTDGMRGALLSARRGRATVFADSRRYLAESRVRELREQEVALLKLPQAVLLGSRKRGVKERHSERKAEACRRNGLCPVRPGSRPRGRPRANLVAGYHSNG